MRFFLLVSLALAATLYVASCQSHVDPVTQVLLQRAREIIHRAEEQLHRHHEGRRHHLTAQLEKEIESLRHYERELLSLIDSRHLEFHEIHMIEEHMLHLENRISEELLRVEHGHQREEHDRNNGSRNHEQNELIGH